MYLPFGNPSHLISVYQYGILYLDILHPLWKDALDIAELNERQTFYDITEKALDEAKAAIDKVLAGATDVELTPQNTQIRKLQHELVEQHNLESKSVGEGESRHLRIVGGKDFNQKNGFKEA